MTRMKLSDMLALEQAGAYRLTGWTRRQLNRVDEQTYRWLTGKEYFFSSHAQEKRRDAAELKRRANQDAVRQTHQATITEFLRRYQDAAAVLRASFIPNYQTALYDDFRVDRTIQRLVRYGLVAYDVTCDAYPAPEQPVTLDPLAYWQEILDHLDAANLRDATLNPITLTLAPELRLYVQLQGTVTRWWIDRLFLRTMTATSEVFGECEYLPGRPAPVLCEIVRQEFQARSTQPEYAALFRRLSLTAERIDAAIHATLNEAGRQAEFEAWARQSGAYARFHAFLDRPVVASPFEVLGVRRDATPQELKSAFRALCKQHHPDVGGDPQKFIEVKEAYDRISARTSTTGFVKQRI